MTKVVVSFSLSQNSIDKLSTYSKAFGFSKSGLIDALIQNFEIPEGAEEIRKLQEEAKRMLFGEDEE